MNMYKNVKAVNEIRNVSHMRYKSVIKSKYRHRHKYKHKKSEFQWLFSTAVPCIMLNCI